MGQISKVDGKLDIWVSMLSCCRLCCHVEAAPAPAGHIFLLFLILCYMDRREGDAAENLNIRSSRGASEYSLIFQTDLPCARVQFIFSNCPAGRPSTVWFFKLSCRAAESNWQAGRGRSIRRPDEVAVGNRVRSPDRSAEAGLSIGQGRPAGQFEKPNCKRPPGRTVWKNELY